MQKYNQLIYNHRGRQVPCNQRYKRKKLSIKTTDHREKLSCKEQWTKKINGKILHTKFYWKYLKCLS